MSSNINIKQIGKSFFINVVKSLNNENTLVNKFNQLKDNDYVKKDVLRVIGPNLNLSLKNYERMEEIQKSFSKIHNVLGDEQKTKLDNLDKVNHIDTKELNEATNDLKNLIKSSQTNQSEDYK